MIDMETIQRWVRGLGYAVTTDGPTTLRIRPPAGRASGLPPFYLQLSHNWLLLSILPFFPEGSVIHGSVLLRMLGYNRDMRVAKFALGEGGEVVLCAELPTESLDEPEVVDAIERMVSYAQFYREKIATLL